ncbi:hypothetical protein TYRP_023558, partial [Tyrophagus putrescentiae]
MRMLVLLLLQPQRSRQPVSARLSRVAVAAATAALGYRESTVMRGSSAQHGAARSDVTWAMCNARRLGPCERSGGRWQSPKVSRRSGYRSLSVHGTKRRGLASLDLPRTSAAEGLARERARPEAAGVFGKSSEAR